MRFTERAKYAPEDENQRNTLFSGRFADESVAKVDARGYEWKQHRE